MTFKLQENPTFVTTAIIAVPNDSGAFEDQTLSVRFRVLPDDAMELPPLEFLKRAILRIDDVVTNEGAPIPSSESLIALVLEQQFTRLPLIKAYMAALTGARVGNSSGPERPGPMAG